jgi:hypothetical protein
MRRLWDQRTAESKQAFIAFKAYLTMGVERSIDGAHCLVRKVPPGASRAQQNWFRWAEKFDWVGRAAAYDDHFAEVRLRAIEEQARASAALWFEREEQIRERGYKISQEFLDKVEKMLDYPLHSVRKVVSEEGEIMHFHPAKWNLATAAKFLDTAYKTASLSAGMETERILHSIDVKDQNAAILQAVKESLAEVINDDAIFVKVLERLEVKINTIEQGSTQARALPSG